VVTSELLADIQRAFQQAFYIDPLSVSMDTVPADIGQWDSVGHMTLAVSLESVFKVNFDVDELMEMENVREIARILQSKREQA